MNLRDTGSEFKSKNRRLVFTILPFLCTHLHPSWLNPRLVAELDQSHQHGQAQPTNQDVENSSYIAQTERASFVLSAQRSEVRDN